MSAKPGLGRGLDTLIPKEFDTSILESSEKVQQIALSDIEPNPDQPRKHFDEEALQELANSIKNHGIVQPLVVIKEGGSYRIVAGERRWRAAKIAGLTKVPVIVRSMKQLEELEIAIIENVQRVDLSPLEQALSIERLHDQFSLSYGDIAKKLGKAVPTIHNTARLLQLPQAAKDALSRQLITEGHARAVLALKDEPERQNELLNSIMSFGWSVRQAEQFVNASKKQNNTDQPKTIKKHMATHNEDTIKIGERLHTQVTIKRTAKGGKLEIFFKDDSDLSRITKSLL
jgi:ParB family chromosome partitioning protein